MDFKSQIFAFSALTLLQFHALAGPVVLNGEMLSGFFGQDIHSIRITRMDGTSIPFQIDEVTEEGEYVLCEGEDPNCDAGDGTLNQQDEIVFLWDDADTLLKPSVTLAAAELVELRANGESRAVIVSIDSAIQKSTFSYIQYDHATEMLNTPYFYAQFAQDRFHFNRAGVRDFSNKSHVDLTNELRVKILFRALWGLIPISYDEDNIVSLVRRYKTGPVRLIRRGDFHLNLGLGVKGSRAAVDQVCYPQMVKVPVYVHVPFRFRSFFTQAYIEMTPVMRDEGERFVFSVPGIGFETKFSRSPIDTLLSVVPDRKLFTVTHGSSGYGWLLQTTMESSLLEGSGFLFRKPSSRDGGLAESGYRLVVRNVPRGYYHITNWVLFSSGSSESIQANAGQLSRPVEIIINGQQYTSKLTDSRRIVSVEVHD